MAQSSKLALQFGRRVSELRRRRNLTQQQLARKIDLSMSGVAFLETGKRWPRAQTIEKLAEALDVHISEFFKDLE